MLPVPKRLVLQVPYKQHLVNVSAA